MVHQKRATSPSIGMSSKTLSEPKLNEKLKIRKIKIDDLNTFDPCHFFTKIDHIAFTKAVSVVAREFAVCLSWPSSYCCARMGSFMTIELCRVQALSNKAGYIQTSCLESKFNVLFNRIVTRVI